MKHIETSYERDSDVHVLGDDSKGLNPGVNGIVTLWKMEYLRLTLMGLMMLMALPFLSNNNMIYLSDNSKPNYIKQNPTIN